MFNKKTLWVSLLLSGFIFSLNAAATSPGTVLDQADKQIAAGKYEDARKSLDAAINANTATSKVYQKLAGLQIINQEYADSIPNFQKAIGLDQKNGAAFLGLGFAYLHMGKYGPARAALVEAENLIPARKQEIHQVITWLDKRSGMSGSKESTHLSMPEAVKAAAGHSKK